MLQLNKEATSKSESEQANGFIEKSPIYVTAYPPAESSSATPAPAVATAAATSAPPPQDLELTQLLVEDLPKPTNGRQEVLIGQDAGSPADNRVRTTAIVENHRGLSVSDDAASRSVPLPIINLIYIYICL